MSRIIGGRLKGRRLRVPPSGTRPTSDRVRESLFSVLEHGGYLDFDCAKPRVLDLFAGSGALGFEAVSRRSQLGLTAVDISLRASRVLEQNARALGVRAEVVCERAHRWLNRQVQAGPAYHLVFVDPPYDIPGRDLARILASLAEVTHAGATVVVERAARDGAPQWPAGLAQEQVRKYGDTALWLAVRSSDGGEEPSDGGEEPSDGGEEPSDGGEEPSDGGEEPPGAGEQPAGVNLGPSSPAI